MKFHSTNDGSITLLQKNILVVGAPRSGTSLTAAAFARAGWYIGEQENLQMRNGDDGNPFGYFEADEMVAANVEVLRAAGFPHHNTWMFDEISEESIRRIEELEPTAAHRRLVEGYDARAPWLRKDPRLCFTLCYWWKFMDPKQTRAVLVRRSFEQIHISFVRRNWCETGKAARDRLERRIARHMQAAESAISRLNIPFIEIHYEDCMKEPQEAERRMAAFCGASRGRLSLNSRPELNHSTARGRVAARMRRSLDGGYLQRIKFLKPLMPAWLLSAVMPEKRYERSEPE